MRNRGWFAIGVVSGTVLGLLAMSGAQHAYRRDLFSRHPWRRMVALGHLAGYPTVSTAQLLREYIAWERSPLLRGRAVRMLRHVERTLG